jgi:hypothetical protein
MTHFDDTTRKFCNHRRWRDFVGAVHQSVTRPCTVTYPMVLGALRSSRAWFDDTAARGKELKSCGCAVRP